MSILYVIIGYPLCVLAGVIGHAWIASEYTVAVNAIHAKIDALLAKKP